MDHKDSVKFRKAYLHEAYIIDELNKFLMVENYTEDWITKIISSETADAIVAIIDKKIIGYVLVALRLNSENKIYGCIVSVAILPEFRRKGYAQKLIELAEESIVKMKVGIMEIQVRKSNKPAQKLYEKLGYEIVDDLKKYYKAGESILGEKFESEDGYLMRKYL